MDPTGNEITRLLEALRRGEDDAMDRLMPRVYGELHALARAKLGRRRPGETLDTTALLHETYLRLADSPSPDWRDRAHFMAVAALAMRQIVVDHVRRRVAEKRGGRQRKLSLSEAMLDQGLQVEDRLEEVLALDEALSELAGLEPRLARLVELRFFGGLTFEEAAEVLDVSLPTVKRDWRKARAFLFHELEGGAEED